MTIQAETILRFLRKRMGLKAEQTEHEDVLKVKLLQWNGMVAFRLKTTDTGTGKVTIKKEDLENVDAVLFLLDKTAWSESYLAKASVLKTFLGENGEGEVNLHKLNVSDYLFFDLKTANAWMP